MTDQLQAIDADVSLDPLQGEPRTLEEWLITFRLAAVVLDPFTHESAWILETAGRILRAFTGADCRVAWIVTGTDEQARLFLGPWADELLTFSDPDRAAVTALGLDALPAFVHLRQDLALVGKAEGWAPEEWEEVAEGLATATSWHAPLIPQPRDPGPYPGTPAAG